MTEVDEQERANNYEQKEEQRWEEINNVKRGNPGTGKQITTNKRKNRDGRGDKQCKER
jgi:hypothetical protein